MAKDESEAQTPCGGAGSFASTHWSVILSAGQSDSRAHDALAQLCKGYWYPLYAYARRRGCSPHDAQDLTQGFFARFLEGNWVSKANRARGRFRSFLLSAMKHFMANEWNKSHAQKRGDGLAIFSLNDDSPERRYLLEPVEKTTPESLYERRWALTLLDSVLARLEEEHQKEGKQSWIEAMRPALTMDPRAMDYKEMARKLEITETAARVAVHRLRKRYRQLIRAEVARTVISRPEVETEIRHLFRVLTSG